MLALLLLLQAQSADIVITGRRLMEVQAECARGGCTPLRDAQASIAVAEMQFRDGKYQDAKKLLSAAIARNRTQGADAPRPVAALYEAYATVSLHEGDRDAFRRATVNQVETLRDNLPPDDPAVVSASTTLGDMWISLGSYKQAELTYGGIERIALSSGQDRAAMLAGMKRAWLFAAMEKQKDAAAKLAELESRPLAQTSGYRTALRVLRLRIRAREADDAEMAALIAQVSEGQSEGSNGEAGPILLLSPAYGADATGTANADARKFGLQDAVQAKSNDYAGIQWVDVGFWIRPNGRTDDIEVLRGSSAQAWAKPALTQIAGRRYSASKTSTASKTTDDSGIGTTEGVYRVERITKGTTYMTPIGSAIKRRIASGGFEVLDLTGAPAEPPK